MLYYYTLRLFYYAEQAYDVSVAFIFTAFFFCHFKIPHYSVCFYLFSLTVFKEFGSFVFIMIGVCYYDFLITTFCFSLSAPLLLALPFWLRTFCLSVLVFCFVLLIIPFLLYTHSWRIYTISVSLVVLPAPLLCLLKKKS